MGWLLISVLIAVPADTIENFESGRVELFSFPNQDLEPDSWQLDSVITHNHSRYALKLSGNTWKVKPILPIALDTNTVIAVYVYVTALAEIQGFGLIGAAETLFYSFAGTEKVDPEQWITVYQGAFPLNTWNCYLLPVGEDWLARFSHLATVTGIVFINDRDSLDTGVVYFDDIVDITRLLPVAPQVTIWYETGNIQPNQDGSFETTAHFYSRVTDPDSRAHRYFWSFGDGATSTDSCPVHTYTVRDEHLFTVLCEVCDSTDRWGRDSARVKVEPGESSFPLKLNFVGDVMLARRYDLPGGIIDSLGPEGVFARVKHLLGDAADITSANLECPLTDQGTPHPTKPIVFRGRPTNVRGLTYAGIDFVSLANNHIIDYGLAGLNQTCELLNYSAGIKYSGAGTDAYQAFQPAFLVKSGVNFGFLCYSDRTGQYDNYQPYLNAGYNKPGFAEQDTWRIFQALNQAKKVSDFIIVQLHAGEEYSEFPFDQSDDEWYYPAAENPNCNAIQLRHRIIDQGADLIICHHPHILQGLEVYQGKLITHSLGNFAFDQEYPETYPSIILQSLLDQRGFYHFTVTPVYIDDYIPGPAKGELGVNILRHLARLSRDLNTYLIVDRESATAHVVLDTTQIYRRMCNNILPTSLLPDTGWMVSVPCPVSESGDIWAINEITPAGDWQVRFGREIVWFGNMEDEGATMWFLNQPAEFYDSVARRGGRSLSQIRQAGTGMVFTNLEERPVLPRDSGELTVYAWIKGDNCRNVNLLLNCYNSRTGGMVVRSCSLTQSLNSTFDWQFRYQTTSVPNNALFFDLFLKSAGPDSGTGQVWFDDVGVIKWTPWQNFLPGMTVKCPNDFNWLQIRIASPITEGEIRYTDVIYQHCIGIAEHLPGIRGKDVKFTAQPTPAHNNIHIRLHLPQTGLVGLKVYNCVGQLVRTLISGEMPAGWHYLQWDLLDHLGQPVAKGTYFCRFITQDMQITRKIIITGR